MNNNNDGENIFGEVIHSYTRAQAIEDGMLIDVTETAKEAGFRMPVAVTTRVWTQCVEVPAKVQGQDEMGRLWDVLWLCRHKIGSSRDAGGDTLFFQVHVRNDNRAGMPPLVTLKVICGPGDQGEPVLTVMLPDED
jgi:hypothetical protein